MAAVGFAGLLVVIMQSDEVRQILTDLVCVHYADRYDAGWWALAPLALSSTACALDPGFTDEG
jgi:hypothetical protein